MKRLAAFEVKYERKNSIGVKKHASQIFLWGHNADDALPSQPHLYATAHCD